MNSYLSVLFCAIDIFSVCITYKKKKRKEHTNTHTFLGGSHIFQLNITLNFHISNIRSHRITRNFFIPFIFHSNRNTVQVMEDQKFILLQIFKKVTCSDVYIFYVVTSLLLKFNRINDFSHGGHDGNKDTMTGRTHCTS